MTTKKKLKVNFSDIGKAMSAALEKDKKEIAHAPKKFPKGEGFVDVDPNLKDR
jgi:hypothetical protein